MLHTLSNSWPLALIVFFACAQPVAKPSAPPVDTSLSRDPKILDGPTAAPADPRRITALRTHGEHHASGTVLLRHVDGPEANRATYMKLAGGRAWLALGQQRAAGEDWPAAIACAQAGLEEFGQPYRKRGMLDDSTLHLGSAQDQIKRGNLHHAASIMLEILEERMKLYAELHRDEITE